MHLDALLDALPLCFRVAVTLQVSASIRLHAHHAGVIYALLGAANRGIDGRDCFPDGAIVHAPEQCRVRLEPGDTYTFGWTLVSSDRQRATEVTGRVLDGLEANATAPALSGMPFRGNFRIVEAKDLFGDQSLTRDIRLSPLPVSRLREEILKTGSLGEVTLRFHSPLRIPRPGKNQPDGHRYWDARKFDPAHFTQRLVARLRAVANVPWLDHGRVAASLSLLRNELVWLDLEYGRGSDRTALGGACGRIALRLNDRSIAPALVLGQYFHVGQNTRFGFGGYRIEQLGPDPTSCSRSRSLLDLAMHSPAFDQAAAAADLPSGACAHLRKQVLAGKYAPRPCIRLPIPKPEGGTRMLAIPPREDAAIQRAILSVVAPGLDCFFESSSIAYRKGLGRARAARVIASAYRNGYRFALKADFARFFDSIDHAALDAHARAYLADDSAADFIMRCVRAGSPFEDRGIPTGSPLSPLLANVFLDSFDERVAAEGGLLVRYADDFVVLYKSLDEANRAFDRLRAAAESLALSLNQDKTRTVDLSEPFVFLGFRFERRPGWQSIPLFTPRPIEDLGWKQAHRPTPSLLTTATLPGESATPDLTHDSFLLVGPGAAEIGFSAEQFVITYHTPNRKPTRVPAGRVREIVAVGRLGLTSSVLDASARLHIPIAIANDSGRDPLLLLPPQFDPDPEPLLAQAAAAGDEAWRLAVSRRLIAAKIHNHACLLRSLGPTTARDTDVRWFESSAQRARAAHSLADLRGIEGAAGARWYSLFPRLVPSWCHWPGRVAPDAADPANLLLNLGQTTLHRQITLALRAAGLAPALGIMHSPRPGHDALASDLQEPFRHLVDRFALHMLRVLRPDDFKPGRPDGPYRLVLAPRAMMQTHAAIHETLALGCTSASARTPLTYLAHIHRSARSLRANLLDRSRVFEILEHA